MRIPFDQKDVLVIKSKICKFKKNVLIYLSKKNIFSRINITYLAALSSS